MIREFIDYIKRQFGVAVNYQFRKMNTTARVKHIPISDFEFKKQATEKIINDALRDIEEIWRER